MRHGNRVALDHLDQHTDSTGLIQHAIYGIPRRESGYTTDDNARALRLCARLWRRQADDQMLGRVATYLGFLEFALRRGAGFHNFLSYQHHWLDAEGGGDCQGQAVRALAEVIGGKLPDDYRCLANELLQAVLPTLADLRSLRAQAYVILAWGHLWSVGAKAIEPLETVAWFAAGRLAECYRRNARADWCWFESRMTYANAVLPHALFVAAARWPNEDFRDIAQESFAFLDRATTVDDFFWPVGNNGWYSRGEQKSPYDQQPVEAVTMAEAALAGFALFDETTYLESFRRASGWFRGENSLGEPLCDGERGACCDGLQSNGVNRNQGAESTLAWLWTQLRNCEIEEATCVDGDDRAQRA
ncbi:MAG TPA: hypothetical protein VF278_14220 [Pirellulales bacterium]